ncbi:ribonuclease H [Senna tora]|uniref:Ribonuclease H n=1 Tax=Senna tora TaxID=362788 RepID=A0A834TKJ0_9FABA|nr:ribonuclease H [Senna tora]
MVQETITKIESKLSNWKAKLLSQAGRKIESLMANFFWGHNENSPKIHLQNWQLLCRPKNEGGLALCNVQAFNEALMAKHLWRIMTEQNSLAVSSLSTKYMDNNGNLLAPSTASWRWKSVLKSKEVILSNIKWQVGDGKHININHHAWWPMLRDQQSCHVVADLIQHNFPSWNSSMLTALYDPNTANIIAASPLSVTGVHDKLIWNTSTDGQYKVRDGYKWLLSRNSNGGIGSLHSEVWKTIWSLKLPYRIVMFMWRVLNDNLPANATLVKHHMPLDDVCHACTQQGETLRHILLDCDFARAVWFGTHLGYKIVRAHCSLLEWFTDILHKFRDEDHYVIPFTVVVLHVIWRCRNLRTTEAKFLDPLTAINMIYSLWNSYKVTFSNQYKGSHSAIKTRKHQYWSLADTLPSSGLLIISAKRNFKTSNAGRKARKIVLHIWENNQILFKAVYSLRNHECPHLMNLIAIRKGIQIALNTTTFREDCKIIVFQKKMACLIASEFKKNSKF